MSNNREMIWTLAHYNIGILRHRFPNYEYEAHEFGPLLLRLEVWKNKDIILIASFSSSFVKIAWIGQPYERYPLMSIEEIDYADPRFTDNTIADILGELAEEE